MKKTAIFLLFAILFTGSEGIGSEKKITIADSSWLPYYGQFLTNQGLIPEIVSAAFKDVGYEVEYNFMSWSRALEAVKAGEFDAAATASFTEERAKTYLYSDPFLETPIVFFKRKDAKITWKTLEDLKPYKIGVLKGYSYSPDFDKANFLKKVVARGDVLNFKKLFYKQVDLVVMDQLVGNHTIKDKLFGREKAAFQVILPQLYSDKLHLMFTKSKKNDSLEKIRAFNKGLGVIRDNGTYDDILARYGIE